MSSKPSKEILNRVLIESQKISNTNNDIPAMDAEQQALDKLAKKEAQQRDQASLQEPSDQHSPNRNRPVNPVAISLPNKALKKEIMTDESNTVNQQALVQTPETDKKTGQSPSPTNASALLAGLLHGSTDSVKSLTTLKMRELELKLVTLEQNLAQNKPEET